MQDLLSICCQHKESQERAWLQDSASCLVWSQVSVESRLCCLRQLGDYSWYISFVKLLPWEQTILKTFGKGQAVHCKDL